MPQIETWSNLPAAIRNHLVERMNDRNISVADLNQLRVWIETKPEVPEGDGTRISGHSKCAAKVGTPKTFLLPGQVASGYKL